MDFKPGISFRAIVPFSEPNICKVHIEHILPSVYPDRKLIIYRVYGKHKQWWHEKMCYDDEMLRYKSQAELASAPQHSIIPSSHHSNI